MNFLPHSNIDLHFESSGKTRGKYLVLDTETTGMIAGSMSENPDQTELPRIIQIAWLLFDEDGKLIRASDRYLMQEMPIPSDSTKIHGIDDLSALQKGENPGDVWSDFMKDLENCDFLVGHNIDFDILVIENELKRIQIENPFAGKRKICTMKQGRIICKIPDERNHGYKYPSLEDLYKMCFFGRLTFEEIRGLHDAYIDGALTAKVFFKMLSQNQIDLSESVEEPFKLPAQTEEPESKGSKFFVNIILPTFLTIILFLLAIFFLIIPRFKENIMVEKRQMIRELTNSATSILEKYGNDEKNGIIARDEAQKQARSEIRYLRYGEENKDYFWITDTHPDMVMHPYRTDLEGSSLTDFTDPHGKRLFVEMVDVAREKGEGYVEYMWQWKDDSTQIVPKLSFVKAFRPWGWIIGTGIYIEDVKKEISSLTRSLLLISSGISLIIALLLTYITLQSLRIEKRRKNAETLLRISREKYKTLVDASNEGLIMIIDDKMIFSNNKFQEMTGFDENELLSIPFKNLINNNNPSEIIKKFQGRNIPDGQYEAILTGKNGAHLDTILSVASIVFYEKKGKLITIRDASVRPIREGDADDIIRLIDFADFGFIRILLDKKGKIVFANKFIVRLLGFQNEKELSGFSILDFIIDPAEKKKYRKILLTERMIRKATIQLKRKDGSACIVSVSMKLVSESPQMICDGIVADITKQAVAHQERDVFISQLQAHSFVLKNPVDPFIIPAASVRLDTPVYRVIELMKKEQTDAVLVTDNSDVRIGIITSEDIRDRLLLTDQNLQKRAFEIMSAPLISVHLGESLDHAIRIMQDNRVSHLIVRDDQGGAAGLITKNHIYQALIHSFSFIESKIDAALTVGELSGLYKEFREYLGLMVRQNISPGIIGRSMASVSDRITTKLIGFAMEEIGEPPVKFVFIALGSEGRQEQTLATDQDNAIIFQDIPQTEIKTVQTWFNRLAEYVCNNLDATGFRFCKGRIMAKNPLWCKPLQTWKNYFTEWIENHEPKNLLEISIFFDFRAIYGSSELADELRTHIHEVSDKKGPFFYNLAENVLSFKSSVGLTGGLHIEKKEDKEFFDLKTGISPFIMFARIYSIYHKITVTSTPGRLRAMLGLKLIPEKTYREILSGYDYLMHLRYRHQVVKLETDEEADNMIDLLELTEMEETMLKKVLSQYAELNNRLNIDFKRSIL